MYFVTHNSISRYVCMRKEGTQILVSGLALLGTQNKIPHFKIDEQLEKRVWSQTDLRLNVDSSNTGRVILSKDLNSSFFIYKIKVVLAPTYKVFAKM